MEDNIRYFIGWYPEHGIFHIIFLHPYILFWEATKLCEEENIVIHSYNNTIKLDGTVYFSSRSSTVMKMSVWGLMTITAVMRNLSALSTSGSGLNMKFCFLNQGCRSKNIVLKPFNMINDRDDIVSLTWTYQCLGWRWPRPPLCWRSGHSSSPRSTSRWGGAGRCRGCRRASRDYPRDSWQRGTPPDPLEEDQMSVTLTITPVHPIYRDTWHDVTRMIERLSPLDPLLLGAEHLPGVVGHQDVHRGGETPPFPVTLK